MSSWSRAEEFPEKKQTKGFTVFRPENVMKLIWDGLQVQIPEKMEVAILDHGYIRLSEPQGPTIDLRFAAGQRPFAADRDGKRIQKAAGLVPEVLARYKEPWADALPGTLFHSSRLFILQFRQTASIVAIHFSMLPLLSLVKQLVTSLTWFPLMAWRPWSCYDIRFQTPPNYALKTARFQPGRFQLGFSSAGNKLIFERLAPANVLLGKSGLSDWLKSNLPDAARSTTTILAKSETEVDFMQPASSLYKILPWLPGLRPALSGKIRHIPESNRLLILTHQGKPLQEATCRRIHDSYASIPRLSE